MAVMCVREYERIQHGAGFQPERRVVSDRQHQVLERINEDYEQRFKARIFGSGPGRSLVAQNFVGVVNMGSDQVEVLPKIDSSATGARRCLARMISAALDLELHGDAITRTEVHGDSVLEVLVRLYCEQLWQALRRGMIRRYEARSDNLHALRGRLLVSAQLRRNLARPDRLYCAFDEFTEDNALNQVLKTALRVLMTVTRSRRNLRSVAELLLCFQDVGELPPGSVDWSRLSTDRLSSRYAPLLRLARLFIEGHSPDVITGGEHGFALVFDMNTLFEAFVGAMAKRAFAPKGLSVTLQGPTTYLARHAAGGDAFALRPDIVVRRGLQSLVVIDTKWKRLTLGASREGVSSGDAYQMYAYARMYTVPDVVLLYPHHGGLGPWTGLRSRYEVRDRAGVMSGQRVSVATIDLCDLDKVEEQLKSILACTSSVLEVADVNGRDSRSVGLASLCSG